MSNERDLSTQIIERWGSKESFYAELKSFLETHRNLDCVIEYDNELQMPIRAVYTFKPIMVAHEHIALMRAIGDANRKAAWEDEQP